MPQWAVSQWLWQTRPVTVMRLTRAGFGLWAGLTVVCTLAAVPRFYRLGDQSFWFDEAYSVVQARKPLGDLLAATAADTQPPLYYLLLGLWGGLFGDSEPALRSLSALLG